MSEDTVDKLIGVILGYCGGFLVVFLIVSGIVDGAGRKVNNHYGPKPPGLVRLTANSFLVEREDKRPRPDLSSEAICGRNNDSHGGADYTGPVTHSPWVLVQCGSKITYSDHRGGSPNLGHAMGRVIKSPISITIALLAAILLSIIPFKHWYLHDRDPKQSRRKKKQAKLIAKIQEEFRAGRLAPIEYDRLMEGYKQDPDWIQQ